MFLARYPESEPTAPGAMFVGTSPTLLPSLRLVFGVGGYPVSVGVALMGWAAGGSGTAVVGVVVVGGGGGGGIVAR